MAPKTSSSRKKPNIKAELVTNAGGTSMFGMAFYGLIISMFAMYGFFVYRPDDFKTYVDQYQFLKPVDALFRGVEKYSPFHEFLNDKEDQQQQHQQQEQVKEKPKVVVPPGQERLFTKEELKSYDGSVADKGPYLAVLGQVFDVSRGKDHYSPGSGYGFFSGIDGSRAFVTGEFNEAGLVDEVSGLSHGDYLGLKEWIEFYHKDYTYVGKVVGRFFDEKGTETPYSKEVKQWIRAAEVDKEQKGEENKRFPGCNTEYSKKKGQRVWCTTKSGGIDRDWVGRPRKLFYPGRAERCACVKDQGPDATGKGNVGDLESPHVKEYEGCDAAADSCQISPPEPEEEL